MNLCKAVIGTWVTRALVFGALPLWRVTAYVRSLTRNSPAPSLHGERHNSTPPSSAAWLRWSLLGKVLPAAGSAAHSPTA